jgi:anti-sigma-K factor RskA
MTDRLDCRAFDELDGALVLGAVTPEEARAALDHLASCDQPHERLHELLGASEALAMSLDPVVPDPGLRDRVMASIERTPQEHRATPPVARAPEAGQGRGWLGWLSPRIARPLAVAAVVGLVAVGGWNLSLQSQVAQRDRALQAVAEAISGGAVAFRVDGSGGRGYVVETPGTGAALVIADLASLPSDKLYELWLLDAAGTPVAVGTFTPGGDALAVVRLERDLSGFATFAVTVEAERLDAPSNLDLVMIADLTGS